jgi:hypothetical protein
VLLEAEGMCAAAAASDCRRLCVSESVLLKLSAQVLLDAERARVLLGAAATA